MDYEETKAYMLFLISSVLMQTYNSNVARGLEKQESMVRAAKEANKIRRVIAPELETVFDYAYWEFLEQCQEQIQN